MGDERFCNKSAVFKYCFFVLVFLITIQIAFNLSVQQAAFAFMSKWVQMSDQMYAATQATAPKSTPETDISSFTNTVVENNVTLICNNRNNSVNVTSDDCLPLCPVTPTGLVGPLATYRESPKYSELDRLFPWVEDGGRGKPSHCFPRHRVAIIIPFRNREIQLRTFLYNIHPILHRQELDYGIYIVDQAGTSQFNRAMLMNIGFAEAIKIHDYQCFVFHDVDLVPENDKNLYNCPSQPRHMSAAIDKFRYRLPYNGIFGGVSALTKEQFQKVNGFSNRYFGWGGEDDDMWNRIHKAGYKVIRYSMDIARYRMIKHGTDKGNKANPNRFRMLKEGSKYFQTDGINSLKYKVLNIQYNHLFTRILVDINEAEVMKASKKS